MKINISQSTMRRIILQTRYYTNSVSTISMYYTTHRFTISILTSAISSIINDRRISEHRTVSSPNRQKFNGDLKLFIIPKSVSPIYKQRKLHLSRGKWKLERIGLGINDSNTGILSASCRRHRTEKKLSHQLYSRLTMSENKKKTKHAGNYAEKKAEEPTRRGVRCTGL